MTVDSAGTHNIEAESAVLGCMMLGCNAPALNTEDFYLGRHQLIFQALVDMQDAGEPIDYVTVVNKLMPHRERFESCGGLGYITSLPDFVADVKNIEGYATVVKNCARDRRLKHKAASIQGATDIDTLEQRVAEFFEEAEKVSGDKHDFTAASVLAKDAFKKYERIANGEKPKLVECGLWSIDRQKLFAPTRLVFLGGSSAMGKTSVGMRIARGAAERGNRVLFISIEMPKEQLADKLFSQVGRIDNEKLTDVLHPEDYGKISAAYSRIAALPLTITDRIPCTIADVRMIIQSYIHEHGGCDLVVLDHFHELQLLPGRKSASDAAHWGDTASKLKALTKRFKIPILALAQLNGNMNKRMPPVPTPKDLKESGTLENVADAVILCYRQDYYEDKGYFNGNEKKLNPDLKNKLLLITGKNRHGKTYTSRFWWMPEYTDIEEVDGRY